MPFNSGEELFRYIVSGAMMTLLPFIVVTTTSFLKLSIVFSILRTALGLQQTPSNMIIFSFSLILTFYIMTPVILDIYSYYQESFNTVQATKLDSFITMISEGLGSYRKFLALNSSPDSINFFFEMAKSKFPDDIKDLIEKDSLAVLMPSFIISQLSDAFKICVLIYLPFLVIDLLVGIILLTLGMMMMSPVVVSLPIKIILFVMLDGWKLLTESLVKSFVI